MVRGRKGYRSPLSVSGTPSVLQVTRGADQSADQSADHGAGRSAGARPRRVRPRGYLPEALIAVTCLPTATTIRPSPAATAMSAPPPAVGNSAFQRVVPVAASIAHSV